jgi:hypothetical protein
VCIQTQVKTIGGCVFNSGWVGECFGSAALEPIKEEAVICSGSTLGSYMGVANYVRTMLTSMDKVPTPPSPAVLACACGVVYFNYVFILHLCLLALACTTDSVLAQEYRIGPRLSKLPLLQPSLRHASRESAEIRSGAILKGVRNEVSYGFWCTRMQGNGVVNTIGAMNGYR